MNDEIRTLLRQPFITIANAGKCLGISYEKAVAQANSGEIETTLIGKKRRLCPTEPLRAKLGLDR